MIWLSSLHSEWRGGGGVYGRNRRIFCDSGKGRDGKGRILPGSRKFVLFPAIMMMLPLVFWYFAIRSQKTLIFFFHHHHQLPQQSEQGTQRQTGFAGETGGEPQSTQKGPRLLVIPSCTRSPSCSWFTYQPAMARCSRSVFAHHHHLRIRTDKSILPPWPGLLMPVPQARYRDR